MCSSDLLSGRAGKAPVEVSYLTGGLSWEATYNLVAPGDGGDEFALSGWVSIRNDSGKDYPDADLKLIAGDVAKLSDWQAWGGARRRKMSPPAAKPSSPTPSTTPGTDSPAPAAPPDVFQPLENFFPTIGKKVSNHWKNRENFFQSLENARKFFPIVGKPVQRRLRRAVFSLDRERGGCLDGGFAAGVGWTPRRART